MKIRYPVPRGFFYGERYVYLSGMQVFTLDLRTLQTTVLPITRSVASIKRIQNVLCMASTEPSVLYEVTPTWEIKTPRFYDGYTIRFCAFYVSFDREDDRLYYLPATGDLYKTNKQTVLRSPRVRETLGVLFDLVTGQRVRGQLFTGSGLPRAEGEIIVDDKHIADQGAGLHAQWWYGRILDTTSAVAEELSFYMDEHIVRAWCGDIHPSGRYYCYVDGATNRFSGLICDDRSKERVLLMLQAYGRGVCIEGRILAPELGRLIGSYL
jgi:hypothetical protein